MFGWLLLIQAQLSIFDYNGALVSVQRAKDAFKRKANDEAFQSEKYVLLLESFFAFCT
jgi:hypothetical protein